MNTINELVVLILSALIVMSIMIVLATTKYVSNLKDSNSLTSMASFNDELENELNLRDELSNVREEAIKDLELANGKEYDLLVKQRLLYKEDLLKKLDMLKELELANKVKHEKNKQGNEIAKTMGALLDESKADDEIIAKAKMHTAMLATFMDRGYHSSDAVLDALPKVKPNVEKIDKETNVKLIKKKAVKKSAKKA